MNKAYQKLADKKRDAANEITHELLEHERIYMQDENIKGWHKGLFGKIVQHSVLGLVKAKLISEPTTKYCPVCGKIKRDIKFSDRIYKDVHAALNMILLANKNTCGTQKINA